MLIKVPLKVKTNFPPIGHLSTLVSLKALQRTLLGSPPKVLPRVLIKASLMVKVSLHLPYSHLLPTPHLVVVHKISLLTSFNSHHFPRCQSGHIVRLAVGILFLPPSLIWSSLSHSYIPSQIVAVVPFHPFLFTMFFLHPGFLFPPVTLSRLFLYTYTTPLRLLPSSIILPLPSSLRGQPGHIVRLVALTSLCPRFLCSPLVLTLSSPSTFSLSSRLSPPLLPPSAPIVSQGVCPKWLGPTWQHLL